MSCTEIKNKDVLEFVIFCIENTAAQLKKDSVLVYDVLARANSFLYDYIAANYETLHTQDKEYIVNDIIKAAQLQGIEL